MDSAWATVVRIVVVVFGALAYFDAAQKGLVPFDQPQFRAISPMFSSMWAEKTHRKHQSKDILHSFFDMADTTNPYAWNEAAPNSQNATSQWHTPIEVKISEESPPTASPTQSPPQPAKISLLRELLHAFAVFFNFLAGLLLFYNQTMESCLPGVGAAIFLREQRAHDIHSIILQSSLNTVGLTTLRGQRRLQDLLVDMVIKTAQLADDNHTRMQIAMGEELGARDAWIEMALNHVESLKREAEQAGQLWLALEERQKELQRDNSAKQGRIVFLEGDLSRAAVEHKKTVAELGLQSSKNGKLESQVAALQVQLEAESQARVSLKREAAQLRSSLNEAQEHVSRLDRDGRRGLAAKVEALESQLAERDRLLAKLREDAELAPPSQPLAAAVPRPPLPPHLAVIAAAPPPATTALPPEVAAAFLPAWPLPTPRPPPTAVTAAPKRPTPPQRPAPPAPAVTPPPPPPPALRPLPSPAPEPATADPAPYNTKNKPKQQRRRERRAAEREATLAFAETAPQPTHLFRAPVVPLRTEPLAEPPEGVTSMENFQPDVLDKKEKAAKA